MPSGLRRGAALVSILGAIAVVAAGCGASTSGSAAGRTASAGVTATTNAQGGVLGAQATLGQIKLHAQASNALQTADNLVAQLAGVHSANTLAQTAKTARAQIQAIVNRLQKLNLSNANAKQARSNLVSSLQKLSSQLQTVQTDAQNGKLSQALSAASNTSAIAGVQNAVQQVSGLSTAALQNMAASIAAQMQQRLANVGNLHTKQGLTNAISQVQSYVQRAHSDLSSLPVPGSRQQTKQQLLTFLKQWQTDLQSAKQHAQQGQLAQAKKQAVGLSLQDLQSLVTKLFGSSGGTSTTTTTTSG